MPGTVIFLFFYFFFIYEICTEMSNSSRANTKTLPECKKKLQYIIKITFESGIYNSV